VNPIKKLFGQTMVYGLGIVVPRVLNYLLLTPFYTRVFTPAQYGLITELYTYVVFLMVLLTYGLETGFFRFSGKQYTEDEVFKTALWSIIFTTFLFLVGINLINNRLIIAIAFDGPAEAIRILAFILAIDTITSIPFAKLRLNNNAKRYAFIRIAEVVVNIFFNWFFLFYCKSRYEMIEYEWIRVFFNPDKLILYVLWSNLAGSLIKMILLMDLFFYTKSSFNWSLWKELLRYSAPLLIAGMAGSVNEAIDRIMLKFLIVGSDPMYELGIYGANYKLAVLMTLFIQMFRYAAEPFFFQQSGKDNTIYALVMNYFVFCGLFIFLVVMLFIPYFSLFIGPAFRDGIGIVPVVLLANLGMGIFFNQSIWYKLKNFTKYGAYLVLIGSFITIVLNYIFIPVYGYYACAWTHLITYTVMIWLSYRLSLKHNPIFYHFRKLLIYLLFGLTIYFISLFIHIEAIWVSNLIKILFLALFVLTFYLIEIKKRFLRNDRSEN